MKKILTLTIIGLTSIALLTGCKTATNPSGQVQIAGQTINPQGTAIAVRIAAKLGAMAAIKQNPETRIYFQLSANAIAATIATGNYNPANLEASISSLGGDQIVSSSIADALSLYTAFFGNVVAQKLDDKSPYTIPVLQGLAAGLLDAVNMTAPSTQSIQVTVPVTVTPTSTN